MAQPDKRFDMAEVTRIRWQGVVASKYAEDRRTGCWTWTSRLDKEGYGRVGFRHEGKTKSTGAHRAVWQAEVGPIPDGLQIDHLCCNRACVNPAHLELVTARENILRAVRYSTRPGRAIGLAGVKGCPEHAFHDGGVRDGEDGLHWLCRICTERGSKANEVLEMRNRPSRSGSMQHRTTRGGLARVDVKWWEAGKLKSRTFNSQERADHFLLMLKTYGVNYALEHWDAA